MPDDNFLDQKEIDALLKAVNEIDSGKEAAAGAQAPVAGAPPDKAAQGETPPADAENTAGEGTPAGTAAGTSGTEGAAPGGAGETSAAMPPAGKDAPADAAGTVDAAQGTKAGGAAAPPAGEDAPLSAACRQTDELSPEEQDALGEIGNISMGSAATTLSELLGQKVNITSPRVVTCLQEKLFQSFKIPYIIIQVEFKEGLQGFNVLIIQLKDAMIMADLMMGGDGTQVAEHISEMEISAASEAMNQMIGTASTSLATMFHRTVNISPPTTKVLEMTEGQVDYRLPTADPIVVVSFKMTIGTLVDTEIMQIMSINTAREEAALLLGELVEPAAAETAGPADTDAAAETAGPADTGAAAEPAAAPNAAKTPPPAEPKAKETAGQAPAPGNGAAPHTVLTAEEQRKLELLLDIPLKVSVVLGRSRRPIKDVLGLSPGAIVELSALVDEPVEVLVNGTLIARGEVVVVNENFGVRITSIITPKERVEQLGPQH